ncbi:hypothetical protein Baya_0898 [Bagarius yarrelli]|uniref:Uncharacterized protein n=1 Tax=Bagarius yarrelli TaxID=175774 RepID=A0A556TJK7_BAGYA|nr:hypothetical protein Baya_0898 [Bagarius yarrelli]
MLGYLYNSLPGVVELQKGIISEISPGGGGGRVVLSSLLKSFQFLTGTSRRVPNLTSTYSGISRVTWRGVTGFIHWHTSLKESLIDSLTNDKQQDCNKELKYIYHEADIQGKTPQSYRALLHSDITG